MSVFVDTGVFYAHHDRDATRHESATVAFERVIDGTYGQLYTSDYVYDEAVTLTQSRTGSYKDARLVGDRILGNGDFPEAIELLLVSDSVFHDSVMAFDRYHDHSLSFTDATTVALVERHDIDYVLSFDDDFDGVVERLDPTDV